jgi:hypothetical protein
VRDLGFHLVLFLFLGIAIVTLSAFFVEAEDRAALRSLPRRLLVFFVGCAVLAALMLLAEHTVASVH